MFLKNFLNKILYKNKILIIFRFGKSVGDQLCLTAVIKSIKDSYNCNIILFTNYPELFLNNPNFYKIFYLKNFFLIKIANKIFKYLEGNYVLEYRAREKENINYFMSDRGHQHLAMAHASHFKIYNNDNIINCEFYFTDKEIFLMKKKYNFEKKFALVQSETKKTFTVNKNWFPDRFNEVVKNINVVWVQIGSNSDYKLNDVIDFRGTTIRELAYLVSKCEFILCLEGFLNHLGSCFKKKTFVITSGFIPKETVQYENSIFIKSTIKPVCDPCYLLTKCPIKDYPCMNGILASDVINIINKNNF
jgi:ADP-heptose:LPS heptosyltransferase